jgi:hypothetical protein
MKIWLSYDLGIRGDYDGIYRWLADHNAEECGDSVAVLSFADNGDLRNDLKKDLKKHVKTDARTRIYLVSRGEKGMTGSFVMGGRKSPPWTGFSSKESTAVDDEYEL